jgi:hypothetical protein
MTVTYTPRQQPRRSAKTKAEKNITQQTNEINLNINEYLENNIRVDPSEYDDNYAPITSPAGNVMENRHEHCPTILYMYSVKNRTTRNEYLKVGIARINWKLCGKHKYLPKLFKTIIRWNREAISNEIIRNTYITRMKKEKNSFQNRDDYVFTPRFRRVRLFPTFTAAIRNETKILNFLKALPGTIPNPPILGTNGATKTEFFNYLSTIDTEEEMTI